MGDRCAFPSMIHSDPRERNIQEIGGPMISTRNRVQIEIANAMKKVANSTPGTQERRVAISNADPEGSGSHWFALCYEITKAP